MYTAHIRVKNTNVGDKYYGHTVSEVDRIKIESPTRSSVPHNEAVYPVTISDSKEDIHQLLSKGVQFPQAMADDILARNSIANQKHEVKPDKREKAKPIFSNDVRPYAAAPRDYAALLRELAKERGEAKALTPEQRRALEAWNSAFPELRMSEEEFLAR